MRRLLPIWPGIRIPLKTRAGKALAPIEPGARTLCEPWLTGPRLKLWRLIPPWKPLPIEIPATLTFWPASKPSTVTSSPTFGPSPSSPRAEILVAELDQVAHRRRAGLLQVAFLGLASACPA